MKNEPKTAEENNTPSKWSVFFGAPTNSTGPGSGWHNRETCECETCRRVRFAVKHRTGPL